MLIRVKKNRYKVGYFGSKRRMCVKDTFASIETVKVFFENNETIAEAEEYVERLNHLYLTAELAKLTNYEVVAWSSSESISAPESPLELCGSEEPEQFKENGLKWGCEACGHTWYGSHFVTFGDCPKCYSEHISHY